MVANDFGSKPSRMDECLTRWTLESYCTSLWGAPDKSERGGMRLLWKSPFRDEQSASFIVEPGKGKHGNGLWHDFGGDGGGSIFDLVMRLNNLSKMGDTFDYLLGPEAPKQVYVKRPTKAAIPFTAHHAPPLSLGIAQTHHDRYMEFGSSYFQRRGISEETITEQLLGMEEGVSERFADGQKWCFPWRRFTIPYWSGVAVKGMNRRLDDDFVQQRIKGEDEEGFVTYKYHIHKKRVEAGKKNTEVTDKEAIQMIYGAKYMIYTDGESESFPYYGCNVLWKLDSLGRIILDKLHGERVPELEWWETMLIVEGELKALALMECGYPAIFMKHHAKNVDWAWLFSMCKRVVILRDPDESGISQAEKLQEKIGLKAVVVDPLPKFKGADDMILAGKIDTWAQQNRVLPYFIPRSKRGGMWSGTAVNVRTV